jgi:YggT family protein
MVLSRNFSPHGALVLLLEVVYSTTDPPVKALRRLLPPIRIGQVSLDLSIMVLFIVLYLLYNTARGQAS